MGVYVRIVSVKGWQYSGKRPGTVEGHELLQNRPEVISINFYPRVSKITAQNLNARSNKQ